MSFDSPALRIARHHLTSLSLVYERQLGTSLLTQVLMEEPGLTWVAVLSLTSLITFLLTGYPELCFYLRHLWEHGTGTTLGTSLDQVLIEVLD